jgi:hypothetical protein
MERRRGLGLVPVLGTVSIRVSVVDALRVLRLDDMS